MVAAILKAKVANQDAIDQTVGLLPLARRLFIRENAERTRWLPIHSDLPPHHSLPPVLIHGEINGLAGVA